MTKSFWGVAFILLASSLSGLDACAAEKLAAQMQAGEHRLILNGSGVRTKLLLELYVAGLYLGPSPVSVPVLMRELVNKSLRGVS